MDAASMDKLRDADRHAIVTHATLGPEARSAIADCITVPHLIATLIGHGFLVEAARCFAHALPRREAVWWACMCAQSNAPADLAEADRRAREAAETWVRTQTEASRYAAMALAEQVGFQTPEAWAAVGAFWSGPSIAPEAMPPNPPAPHLTGVAVAGAVILASVRGDPALRLMRLERYLGAARDIAQGGAGRIAREDAS
ncbi:hypothetical protein AruPA_11605 [Acidiphilium sp. PA]|uniref:DUF6931 family protein n=1 Tax=Acidiphilium sp. PA TaxID=2871705 RepID=UPI0022431A0F|nr:hypothetical protein [Acidiphilium sp. PA]MCW8307687.1 hypothetical protein [Acidiphilium sp. PA]